MSESVFSFVYDKKSAEESLAAVPARSIVLALLARQQPKPEWDGCEVYLGRTPLDQASTRCVATRGPRAEEVQQYLVEQFEATGVEVIKVYEGGPGVEESIAFARPDGWKET